MESRVTLLSIFQPPSGALRDKFVWNLEEIAAQQFPETMKTLLALRPTQLTGSYLAKAPVILCQKALK